MVPMGKGCFGENWWTHSTTMRSKVSLQYNKHIYIYIYGMFLISLGKYVEKTVK